MLSSGKFARPINEFSLNDKLIKFDQVGAPITNALVPSIGSIDHLKLLVENLSSNSSPIIESLGNFLLISDLIYFSKARSKLVTGSKSFFEEAKQRGFSNALMFSDHLQKANLYEALGCINRGEFYEIKFEL